MFAMMFFQRVRRFRVLKFMWLEVSWIQRKVPPYTPLSTKASNSKKPVRYTSIKKAKPKTIDDIAKILLQKTKETKEGKQLEITVSKNVIKAATLNHSNEQSDSKPTPKFALSAETPAESVSLLHTESVGGVRDLQEVVSLSSTALNTVSENKTTSKSLQYDNTGFTNLSLLPNQILPIIDALPEVSAADVTGGITQVSLFSEERIFSNITSVDSVSDHFTPEDVSMTNKSTQHEELFSIPDIVNAHANAQDAMSSDLTQSTDDQQMCMNQKIHIGINDAKHLVPESFDPGVESPPVGVLPKPSDRGVVYQIFSNEAVNSSYERLAPEVVDRIEMVSLNSQKAPSVTIKHEICDQKEQFSIPEIASSDVEAQHSLQPQSQDLLYLNSDTLRNMEEMQGEICVENKNAKDLASKPLNLLTPEPSTLRDSNVSQISFSSVDSASEKSTPEVVDMVTLSNQKPPEVSSTNLNGLEEIILVQVDRHVDAECYSQPQFQDLSLDLRYSKDAPQMPLQKKEVLSSDVTYVDAASESEVVLHNENVDVAEENLIKSIQKPFEGFFATENANPEDQSLYPKLVCEHIETQCPSQPGVEALTIAASDGGVASLMSKEAISSGTEYVDSATESFSRDLVLQNEAVDLAEDMQIKSIQIPPEKPSMKESAHPEDLFPFPEGARLHIKTQCPSQPAVEAPAIEVSDGEVDCQMSDEVFSSCAEVVDCSSENFTPEVVKGDETFGMPEDKLLKSIQKPLDVSSLNENAHLETQFVETQDLASPTWSSDCNPEVISLTINEVGYFPDGSADVLQDVSQAVSLPILVELTSEASPPSPDLPVLGSISLREHVACVSEVSEGIQSSAILKELVLEQTETSEEEKLVEVDEKLALLDPVQRLFLDKIREYSIDRAFGDPVDVEYEKVFGEELSKLQRLYGGGDLTRFPEFRFSAMGCGWKGIRCVKHMPEELAVHSAVATPKGKKADMKMNE